MLTLFDVDLVVLDLTWIKTQGYQTSLGVGKATRTVLKARTRLQPQFQKVVTLAQISNLPPLSSLAQLKASATADLDWNPKDFIVFSPRWLKLQKQHVRNYAGRYALTHDVTKRMPAFDWPSDHALLCATLQPQMLASPTDGHDYSGKAPDTLTCRRSVGVMTNDQLHIVYVFMKAWTCNDEDLYGQDRAALEIINRYMEAAKKQLQANLGGAQDRLDEYVLVHRDGSEWNAIDLFHAFDGNSRFKHDPVWEGLFRTLVGLSDEEDEDGASAAPLNEQGADEVRQMPRNAAELDKVARELFLAVAGIIYSAKLSAQQTPEDETKADEAPAIFDLIVDFEVSK